MYKSLNDQIKKSSQIHALPHLLAGWTKLDQCETTRPGVMTSLLPTAIHLVQSNRTSHIEAFVFEACVLNTTLLLNPAQPRCKPCECRDPPQADAHSSATNLFKRKLRCSHLGSFTIRVAQYSQKGSHCTRHDGPGEQELGLLEWAGHTKTRLLDTAQSVSLYGAGVIHADKNRESTVRIRPCPRVTADVSIWA